MHLASSGPPRSPLANLRRYLAPREARTHCELCSAELPEIHDHLLELDGRRISCACEACAILFSNPAAPKYRRVPRRAELLADFQLSDVQWQALDLPIELAFLVWSGAAQRVVAFYPSPAGAAEALPPPDAWQALVDDNPAIANLEPDVEALLVNRLGPAPEVYRVGIDHCYELVGRLRTQWRGMSGGTQVWADVARYFTTLRQRCGLPGDVRHA